MTLYKVIVRISRTEFSPGLLYTGCSRVTNERDLAIENGMDYSDVQKKGREVGKEGHFPTKHR